MQRQSLNLCLHYYINGAKWWFIRPTGFPVWTEVESYHDVCWIKRNYGSSSCSRSAAGVSFSCTCGNSISPAVWTDKLLGRNIYCILRSKWSMMWVKILPWWLWLWRSAGVQHEPVPRNYSTVIRWTGHDHRQIPFDQSAGMLLKRNLESNKIDTLWPMPTSHLSLDIIY